MKFQIIAGLAFLLCIAGPMHAQTDSTLYLEGLATPAAPGFMLLGIEPTSIETPGTPADFAVSVLNSTNDLSRFPRSWAMELAPGWVFGGKSITYEDFTKNDLGRNIKQSFTVSVATNTVQYEMPETNVPRMGIGFRVSLLRGKFDPDFEGLPGKLARIETAADPMSEYFQTELFKRISEDTLLQFYIKTMQAHPKSIDIVLLTKLAADRETQIHDALSDEMRTRFSDSLAIIRDVARSVKFNRTGFNLDLAGGVVLDFPTQNFNNSNVSRYGAWLTGSYDFNNLKWLGVARLLDNPNELTPGQDTLTTSDNLYFDIGTRLKLKEFYRTTLSAEYLYRMPFSNTLDPSHRFVINVEYRLDNNKLINFSIGKQFDGPIESGGNLVSALNLILGFGGERPFK